MMAEPELHDPPVVAHDIDADKPWQIAGGPVTGNGNGFTVIILVTKQPVGNIYEMVTVPVETLVTIPEEEPTVATEVLLLLHVPPLYVSPSVMAYPRHTEEAPVMAAGCKFIVTVVVARHPVGRM
jgi:hypothetical protein